MAFTLVPVKELNANKLVSLHNKLRRLSRLTPLSTVTNASANALEKLEEMQGK